MTDRQVVVECPGCGGRNPPGSVECDWCGRIFATPGRHLRLAGWHLVTTLLALAVLGAVVALGVLNANRVLPPPRPQAAATIPVAGTTPTPAVTPRVTATPTPAAPSPTAIAAVATTVVGTPVPQPTPSPTVVRRTARVANTDGAGAVVRSQPGPQAPVAGALREGVEVVLVGGEQTVAARRWLEVLDEGRGVRGWVLADLLEPVP